MLTNRQSGTFALRQSRPDHNILESSKVNAIRLIPNSSKLTSSDSHAICCTKSAPLSPQSGPDSPVRRPEDLFCKSHARQKSTYMLQCLLQSPCLLSLLDAQAHAHTRDRSARLQVWHDRSQSIRRTRSRPLQCLVLSKKGVGTYSYSKDDAKINDNKMKDLGITWVYNWSSSIWCSTPPWPSCSFQLSL